jgi:acyl dehydratase
VLAITGADGLRAPAGQELGVSAWHAVLQAAIDAFAAATDDFERIHVDPARGRETPFGTTIAHGLYTLSLGPKFLYELIAVEDAPLALNYGFDRVRFVAPLPVGSRVRMRATLTSVDEVEGGVLARILQTFEREGQEKPVCVADALCLYYDAAP